MTSSFEIQLNTLKQQQQFRELPNFPFSSSKKQSFFNFNSNDYLGMSVHPKVIQALQEGATYWGVGSGGSRLLGKGLPIYQQFEKKLASAHYADKSLLFNSGYVANSSTLSILAPTYDHIYLDKYCHASLIEGIKASQTRFTRYPHLQLNRLEEFLQKEKKKNILVVTETLFSMDGDQTDLKELFKLQKRYDFWVYIDQAHSFGAYPTLFSELIQLGNPQKKIIVGTFGKALGVCGAFVTGPTAIIDFIINYAKGFIYSTALSPAIICAAQKSFEITQEDSSLFQNLQQYILNIQKNEFELFKPPFPNSHICPIILGSNKIALHFSEELKKHHFYLQAIRSPTVPKGLERLRLSLNVSISWKTTQKLLQILQNLKTTSLLK